MPTVGLDPAWSSNSGTNSITSASFSPTAGSLIVVDSIADSNPTGITASIADNAGGALTWAAIGTVQNGTSGGAAQSWWAYTSGALTGTTATVTWAGTGTTQTKAIKVTTYTSTATASAVLSQAQSTSATNNLTVNITTTNAGCRVAGAAIDWNALGAPTSTDTITAFHSAGAISGAAVRKSADSGLAGSSVGLNFDAFGSGAPDWGYKVYEIVPGAAAGSVDSVGPYLGPTPGRLGPTGQWRPQPPGPARPAPAALLGIAAEADGALSLGMLKLRAPGVAAETDTAITLGRVKVKSLGIAAETDVAIAVGSFLFTPGQPYAGPWTAEAPGWQSPTGFFAVFLGTTVTGRAAAAGVAAESDSSLPLGRAKARALGVAAEADAAQPLGPVKTAAVGVATETELAVAVAGSTAAQRAQLYAGPWTGEAPGWVSPTGFFATILGTTTGPLTAAIGTASETDTALAAAGSKTRQLGTAAEADAAQPVTGGLAAAQPYAGPWVQMTPGWISPTGQLSPITGTAALANVTTSAIGTANETDTAQPAGRAKARTLGIAAETDVAIAAGRAKKRLIGVSAETDTALAVSTPGHIFGAVATASETDTAIAAGRVKRRTAGVATSAEAALAMGRRKARTLGIATSLNTAGAIHNPHSAAIGAATEVDTTPVLIRGHRITRRPFTGATTRPFSGITLRP